MQQIFPDKASARRAVWDELAARGAARFPFPPQGRIPNFDGAREAAARLFQDPRWSTARRIKVNPDAAQRPVRELALRLGITIFVPTPRLRGGFVRFDPGKIPRAELSRAASLTRGRRWGEEVPLRALPEMEAIVAGSVAVTRDGRRCGKGEGYSDLEYAILRELGHKPVRVATTVHSLQVVESFPRDPNDLPLALIVTPDETITVLNSPPPPKGIDWSRLTPERLEAMPILKELLPKTVH